MGLGNE